MALSLRHWRTHHLLLAWSSYWVALALAALAPALRVLWRVSRPGAHGSAGASIDDGIARLTVSGPGGEGWVGAVTVGVLALWLVGPPLLLWLLWVLSRPRRVATLAPPTPRDALPDATPGPAASSRRDAHATPTPRGRSA